MAEEKLTVLVVEKRFLLKHQQQPQFNNNINL
jgi:hypothetical protein